MSQNAGISSKGGEARLLIEDTQVLASIPDRVSTGKSNTYLIPISHGSDTLPIKKGIADFAYRVPILKGSDTQSIGGSSFRNTYGIQISEGSNTNINRSSLSPAQEFLALATGKHPTLLEGQGLTTFRYPLFMDGATFGHRLDQTELRTLFSRLSAKERSELLLAVLTEKLQQSLEAQTELRCFAEVLSSLAEMRIQIDEPTTYDGKLRVFNKALEKHRDSSRHNPFAPSPYFRNANAEDEAKRQVLDEFLSMENIAQIDARIVAGESIKMLLNDYPEIARLLQEANIEIHRDPLKQRLEHIRFVRGQRDYQAGEISCINALREKLEPLISKEDREQAKDRAEKEILPLVNKSRSVWQSPSAAMLSQGAKALSDAEVDALKQRMIDDKVFIWTHRAAAARLNISELEGANRDIWKLYAKMIDPKDETLRMSDETWDKCVEIVCINAPLMAGASIPDLVARVGLLPLVRTVAVNTGAKALSRSLTMQALRYGAGVGLQNAAKESIRWGSRLAAAGTVLGIDTVLFEASWTGMQGENLFALPDWQERLCWTALNLSAFHLLGRGTERLLRRSGKINGLPVVKETPAGSLVSETSSHIASAGNNLVERLCKTQAKFITDKAVQKFVETVVVKWPAEAALFFFIGLTQSGVYRGGDLSLFLENCGVEALLAAVNSGALRVSNACVHTAMGRIFPLPQARTATVLDVFTDLHQRAYSLHAQGKEKEADNLFDHTLDQFVRFYGRSAMELAISGNRQNNSVISKPLLEETGVRVISLLLEQKANKEEILGVAQSSLSLEKSLGGTKSGLELANEMLRRGRIGDFLQLTEIFGLKASNFTSVDIERSMKNHGRDLLLRRQYALFDRLEAFFSAQSERAECEALVLQAALGNKDIPWVVELSQHLFTSTGGFTRELTLALSATPGLDESFITQLQKALNLDEAGIKQAAGIRFSRILNGDLRVEFSSWGKFDADARAHFRSQALDECIRSIEQGMPGGLDYAIRLVQLFHFTEAELGGSARLASQIETAFREAVQGGDFARVQSISKYFKFSDKTLMKNIVVAIHYHFSRIMHDAASYPAINGAAGGNKLTDGKRLALNQAARTATQALDMIRSSDLRAETRRHIENAIASLGVLESIRQRNFGDARWFCQELLSKTTGIDCFPDNIKVVANNMGLRTIAEVIDFFDNPALLGERNPVAGYRGFNAKDYFTQVEELGHSKRTPKLTRELLVWAKKNNLRADDAEALLQREMSLDKDWTDADYAEAFHLLTGTKESWSKSEVKDFCRATEECFGWRAMFRLMSRADVPLNLAASFGKTSADVVKAAKLYPAKFDTNILCQVTDDRGQYHFGTSYGLGIAIYSVQVPQHAAETLLWARRSIHSIPRSLLASLPDMAASFSGEKDIFASWRDLQRCYQLHQWKRYPSTLEFLTKIEKAGGKCFVDYLEALALAGVDFGLIQRLAINPGLLLSEKLSRENVIEPLRACEYPKTPYLALDGSELVCGFTNGALDALQVFPPMRVQYTFPSGCRGYSSLQEAVRDSHAPEGEEGHWNYSNRFRLRKSLRSALEPEGVEIDDYLAGTNVTAQCEAKIREAVFSLRNRAARREIPARRFTVRVCRKSDPAAATCGTASKSCDTFGSAQKTNALFNPNEVSLIIELDNGRGEKRIVADAVMTLSRDIGCSTAGFQTALSSNTCNWSERLANAAREGHDYVCLNNIGVNPNYRDLAPELEYALRHFLTLYLNRYGSAARVNTGTVLIGQDVVTLFHGAELIDNTWVECAPRAYSDNTKAKVAKLDLHTLPGLPFEVIEAAELSTLARNADNSAFQPLSFRDTLAVANIRLNRGSDYDPNNIFTPENTLIACASKSALEHAAGRTHPNLSFKHVDTERSVVDGYLIAYEGKLENHQSLGLGSPEIVCLSDLGSKSCPKNILVEQLLMAVDQHYWAKGRAISILVAPSVGNMAFVIQALRTEASKLGVQIELNPHSVPQATAHGTPQILVATPKH